MIRFAKGGEAEVIALDGDRVTLSSTAPAPPGAVVDASLVTTTDGVNASESIRIKVRGCKREGERFRIEGRILDVSRQLRERLSALVSRA